MLACCALKKNQGHGWVTWDPHLPTKTGLHVKALQRTLSEQQPLPPGCHPQMTTVDLLLCPTLLGLHTIQVSSQGGGQGRSSDLACPPGITACLGAAGLA